MNWQKILAQGFNSSLELLLYLNLEKQLAHPEAEIQFKTRVPKNFAKRMEKGNPNDPLLLQVLASHHELIEKDGYSKDPLMEAQNKIKGLLHKYHGRVLLTLTGVCAINCRYCFRRHFPYGENNPGRTGWQQAYDYIAADSSITEVILSGGDPLLAADKVLEECILSLNAIEHLHTLRFHTRIPIVLPERIDQEFLSILKKSRLKKVIVMHCNHAQELNDEIAEVCQRLIAAGCILLNQAVLLKGINDCPQKLAKLSEKLFQCGILPYYLHVLDKVSGATHFDLEEGQARQIYKQLQALLPGYLVPRLVREVPEQAHKILAHV